MRVLCAPSGQIAVLVCLDAIDRLCRVPLAKLRLQGRPASAQAGVQPDPRTITAHLHRPSQLGLDVGLEDTSQPYTHLLANELRPTVAAPQFPTATFDL